MVSAMILLRDVLGLLPSLREALNPSSSGLLAALAATVSHDVFPQLLEEVEAIIDQVRWPVLALLTSF